jgi:hypothetical protein
MKGFHRKYCVTGYLRLLYTMPGLIFKCADGKIIEISVPSQQLENSSGAGAGPFAGIAGQ